MYWGFTGILEDRQNEYKDKIDKIEYIQDVILYTSSVPKSRMTFPSYHQRRKKCLWKEQITFKQEI